MARSPASDGAGAEVRQVGAGAERRRRAGDDDRADAGVALEPLERADELARPSAASARCAGRGR